MNNNDAWADYLSGKNPTAARSELYVIFLINGDVAYCPVSKLPAYDGDKIKVVGGLCAREDVEERVRTIAKNYPLFDALCKTAQDVPGLPAIKRTDRDILKTLKIKW